MSVSRFAFSVGENRFLPLAAVLFIVALFVGAVLVSVAVLLVFVLIVLIVLIVLVVFVVGIVVVVVLVFHDTSPFLFFKSGG